MGLVRVGVDLKFTFFPLDLDQFIEEFYLVRLSSGVIQIAYF